MTKTVKLPSLLVMLLCMGFLNQLPAQIVYQWAIPVSGSTNTENISKLRKDAAGNSYVIGNFQGTVDFDPGPGTATVTSVGSDDVFFAKYSPTGAYLWAKTIGTTSSDAGLDIKVDANAVYISGSFGYGNQSADFDPGPGVANLTSIGNIDAFFGKYDLNGNYIWAHNVASQNNDHGPCISVDPSGNVYIGVMCSVGGIDFDPGPGVGAVTIISPWNFTIAKYSSAGAYLWAKPLATNGAWHWMTELVNDAAGNVYCSGYFSGTTDFDPGAGTVNLTPAGGYDACLLKLDVMGNYQWVKQIGGPSDDFAQGLAINAAQNSLYVTGSFKGTANFNAGGSPMTSVGGDDVYLSKFDNAGAFLWSKRFGGTGDDQSTDLALDTCENVYITGGFNSAVIDLDPGPATANFNTAGNFDVFISKYTDQGCYLLGTTVGGSGIDYANAVTYDTVNFRTNVAGYFNNTVDMDPGGTIANLVASGGQDAFLAQYTAGSVQAPAPSNITPLANLQICPNQTTVLTASSNICAGGIRSWYTASVGGTFLGSGNSYTTAPISVNTTFYVQDSICGSVSNRIAITVTVTNAINLSVSAAQAICAGTTATLIASGASSYTWSPGTQTTATIVVSPTVSTTYTVIGSAATCTALAVTTVSILPSTTLTVNSNTSICPGQSANLVASGGISYTWTPGSLSGAVVTVTPPGTTTYTVTGTNGCGTDTRTVTVSVVPLPTIVVAVSPTLICTWENATLTASGAGNYTWTPGGQTGATFTVSPFASTIYTVSGGNPGCIATSTAEVVVKEPGHIVLFPDLTMGCAPLCFSLQVGNSTDCGSLIFDYGDGTMSSSISHCYLNGGAYTVSATCTTTAGCISTYTLSDTIHVYEKPTAGFSISGGTLQTQGSSVQLQNLSSGAGNYLWTWCNGSTSTLQHPSFPASDTGLCCIQLVAFSQNLCTDTAAVCIEVMNEFSLLIPNVFTPNGDKVNDVFKISATGLRSLHCSIVDRWGLKLYEWDGVDGGWDGKSKSGNMASAGTYFYIVEYLRKTGEQKEAKGYLTLLRD